MISLKLLAAELLFACPGCKEEHQDDLTSLTQDIYVPGGLLPKSTPGSIRVGDIVRGEKKFTPPKHRKDPKDVWRAEAIESVSSPFSLPIRRNLADAGPTPAVPPPNTITSY